MVYFADLHIHSRYSRATSSDSDLEHMAYWARRKGVSVLGTGDFTHPAWLREIEEKLVPAEPGLFRLKPELEAEVERTLGADGEPVRFLLEVEISTIYKKGDRTRKVHHLLYAPGLEEVRRIIQSLERIGNLASDGRPILGLDSRHLLEITLAAGEGCYLVPAHIWTPWFAALGSKSGFDSIEECYGDLAGEIFAVETGLSSDPEMNWRLSQLDRFRLVSNSDAHSPPKIGREASAFDTALDYFAIREALRTGAGYAGSVEFFPEEGKYHLDGHRACGVCLTPEETRSRGGLCQCCGKPLTLGVLHRVSQLADREEAVRPAGAAPYRSLVPLAEVLAEIQGVGPGSKAVERQFSALLSRLGPELFILDRAPLDDVRQAGSSALAEALSRMREGRVLRQAGYDGEYGTIRLFEPGELARRSGERFLFDLPVEEAPPAPSPPPATRATPTSAPASPHREPESAQSDGGPGGSEVPGGFLAGLDPDQRRAAELSSGPVCIIAGPGTGKTRTLTHRIAHLIADGWADPRACLAITFTRRAAAEMHERLVKLLPGRGAHIPVLTFHAFGLSVLREHAHTLGLPETPRIAAEAERLAIAREAGAASDRAARRLLERISLHKREGCHEREGVPAPEPIAELAYYEGRLRARGIVDLDDLILLPVRLLESKGSIAEEYRRRFRWISVDEFQDIDALQYRLLRQLAPPGGNLCVIGDPDQSIYGFRGADPRCFERFQADFPAARTVRLTRNYRSSRVILEASLQAIAPASAVADRSLEASFEAPDLVEVHCNSTERAEAEWVVVTLERLLGGSSFFAIDTGRGGGGRGRPGNGGDGEGAAYSFADFAVLYRTEAQAPALAEALARSGLPFQMRSHERLADLPWVKDLVRELESSAASSGAGTIAELLDRFLAGAEKAGGPPAAALNGIAALKGMAALKAMADRAGGDLSRFRAELELGVDSDLWDPRAERISLLTLHAAKGLEFRVVFIAGCEDGLLPLRFGSDEDPAALEEERRLFFVGMTRARERLFLSHARRRAWRGKVRPMEPSPYLRDVEERLLARRLHEAARRDPPSPFRQLTLFDGA